jgi:hypothetical protein
MQCRSSLATMTEHRVTDRWPRGHARCGEDEEIAALHAAFLASVGRVQISTSWSRIASRWQGPLRVMNCLHARGRSTSVSRP